LVKKKSLAKRTFSDCSTTPSAMQLAIAAAVVVVEVEVVVAVVVVVVKRASLDLVKVGMVRECGEC